MATPSPRSSSSAPPPSSSSLRLQRRRRRRNLDAVIADDVGVGVAATFALFLCLLLLSVPRTTRAFDGGRVAFSSPVVATPPRRSAGPTTVLSFSASATKKASAASFVAPLPRRRLSPPGSLGMTAPGDDDDVPAASSKPWNPTLRKTLGTIASIGVLETGFLTFDKLVGAHVASEICGLDGGGCDSVLDGPYASANLLGMEVPLAALGLLAYGAVAALSFGPLLLSPSSDSEERGDVDANNRIALLASTTTMGTFSVYLMSLLFGVLHASCPFCVGSAILSMTLAVLSWSGGVLPSANGREGATAGLGGFLTATVVALGLFLGADEGALQATQLASSTPSSSSSVVVASADAKETLQNMKPPAITTASSPRALTLAASLNSLDARFFGAYWCSHCYDQKQTLGKEAMDKIPYVECSREGFESQTDLCKERKVPGYPTWEINGELYPGEQSLEELEEDVREALAKRKGGK